MTDLGRAPTWIQAFRIWPTWKARVWLVLMVATVPLRVLGITLLRGVGGFCDACLEVGPQLRDVPSIWRRLKSPPLGKPKVVTYDQVTGKVVE